MTFPNAAKLAQRYNIADMATSRIFTNSTGTKLSAWESILYDENNNRKSELATQAQPTGTAAVTPGTGTFDYDNLDRLTSFKHPFETTTAAYGLDDAGNVKTEPGNTFTFANNRLTDRSVSLTENYVYGYDHFGNQITDTKKVLLQPDAVTTTGYNAASQTKRVTAADGTWVEYNYDGLDRMVSRQDSAGSVVMFFHDGLSQQIAVETNAAATVTSRYLVDAFGVPRGKLDIGNNTGRTYYMTDPRGNVTQMIGYLDQAVKAVFAYDPYGKDKPALSKKIASSNWDSRLKFQMAPKDPKTGTYSLGSRLMNPTINRFLGADNYVAASANLGLQVDPLTGNRYLYAGANPAGLIDDGHAPCVIKRIARGGRDSGCKYSYDLNYTIGEGNDADAEALMAAIQSNPDQFFPFTTEPNELVKDSVVHLKASEGLFGDPGDVQVVKLSKKSFTFKTLPGHVEGANAFITFTVRSSKNKVYLNAKASGPNGTLFDLAPFLNSGRRLVARHLWSHMALNLREYQTTIK
jgi:RHS repeat-associated protein